MRPDANVTVAQNIRAELALADATQADVASYLGRNEMWFSRRMNGSPAFSTNEIQAVADFFGIKPGALFEKADRPGRASGAAGERRSLYLMDGLDGTYRLTADCSAIELRRNERPGYHDDTVIPFRPRPNEAHTLDPAGVLTRVDFTTRVRTA